MSSETLSATWCWRRDGSSRAEKRCSNGVGVLGCEGVEGRWPDGGSCCGPHSSLACAQQHVRQWQSLSGVPDLSDGVDGWALKESCPSAARRRSQYGNGPRVCHPNRPHPTRTEWQRSWRPSGSRKGTATPRSVGQWSPAGMQQLRRSLERSSRTGDQ